MPSMKAREHRHRLSHYTQLLVDAQAAWFRGAADRAESLYTGVVTQVPDDVEAWFLLGDVRFRYNPYRGHSVVEARRPLERALALDPKHVGALAHLCEIAAVEGRGDELESLYERFMTACTSTAQTLGVRTVHAFFTGDEGAQRELVKEMKRGEAMSIPATLADVALYGADLGTTDKFVRSIEDVAHTAELRVLMQLVLAHLAVARQQSDVAAAELERAGRDDPSLALEHRAFFCSLRFVDVTPSELRETRSSLEAWNPPEPPADSSEVRAFHPHEHVHRLLRAYLLGCLCVREGDFDASLAYADECEQETSEVVPEFAAHLSNGVRANVAFAKGEPARALEMLELLTGEYWFQLAAFSPFYAFSGERFLRAEALVALERIDEAAGWFEGLGQGCLFELVFRAPSQERLRKIGP